LSHLTTKSPALRFGDGIRTGEIELKDLAELPAEGTMNPKFDTSNLALTYDYSSYRP
jgi:hypothetical protein